MNTTAFTYCCVFLFVGLLASSLAPDSRAQDSDPPPEELTQTYARPGIPTQTIYIWGDVGTAGVWRVERNIDLVELLSAARLTGIGQANPGYRSRTVIQVHRRSGSGHTLVYEATAEELLAPDATYPGLEDQDVVEVERRTRRKIGFQLISSIVGTAASLTLLVLRLTDGRYF